MARTCMLHSYTTSPILVYAVNREGKPYRRRNDDRAALNLNGRKRGASFLRLGLVIVQRLMLHLAVILDRATRRSGQLKPFARGPDGIASRRALAFEHPGFLLLGRGRLSIRIKEFGSAHVCTHITNDQLVCPLLL